MSAANATVALVVGLLLTARALSPGTINSRSPAPYASVAKHVVGRSVNCGRNAPSAGEWADFLDSACAEVRAGSSLTTALSHARQAHPSLPAHMKLLNSGQADAAVVAQTVTAALALGGAVAATLHSGAALLRERAAQRAEALTHSAQARLSARILTGVPLAFAGWSLLTSASFRAAVLSPTGLATATVGAVLNAIGWLWMRRLVRQAAS